MVSQRDKKQMKDWLVSKLEPSHTLVEPRTNELVSGIHSNYIVVDDDGVVVLVDKPYPGEALNDLYRRVQRVRPNIAAVLFKDGKTFFRSAAVKKRFKKDHGLSLKNYSDDEMHRMMVFRPEEIFLNSERGNLQYYQPGSERLDEGIETFEFEPVVFDYSHIISNERFKPDDQESKRLHIWTQRSHSDGYLVLDEGRLRENGI